MEGSAPIPASTHHWGRAGVLVTRDEDMKGSSVLVDALASIGIAVVSVRQFLAALEKGAGE
jgi:hypothetical protein